MIQDNFKFTFSSLNLEIKKTVYAQDNAELTCLRFLVVAMMIRSYMTKLYNGEIELRKERYKF